MAYAACLATGMGLNPHWSARVASQLFDGMAIAATSDDAQWVSALLINSSCRPLTVVTTEVECLRVPIRP